MRQVDAAPVPMAEDVWRLRTVGWAPSASYTNAYLIRRGGRLLLLDPGWNEPASIATVENGMHSLGFEIKDLDMVVATHAHPDHAGAGDRLRRESGAEFLLGSGEPVADLSPEAYLREEEQVRVWGADPADFGFAAQVEGDLRVGAPDRGVDDGELLLDDLEVVATPGHSDGHISLVDHRTGIAFTGDHVLPRINPHVLVAPGRIANPLAVYLASLDRIVRHDGFVVAPGHEEPFARLAPRVEQLRERILRRNEAILTAMATERPTTVYGLARSIPWRNGWDALDRHDARMSLGLTASHVELLASLGQDLGIPTRVS